MILQFLQNAGDEGAKRDSIYEYLKDVLPANKTEEQQLRYVGRLLVELNEEKQIDRIGLKWILKTTNGRFNQNPTEKSIIRPKNRPFEDIPTENSPIERYV